MVHCCVCANCTNSNLSGHRVHVFPSKRSPVFNSWLKFVQVTRRNFNTNSINTKHSVVCSAHFLDSDYLEGDVLEYRMGFRTKQRIRLKPNAIPSVHTTSTKNTGTASKRKAGNGDSESCPGIMAAVVTHQAVTELLPAVCRKLEASKELRTCTALSSSRMQAGVCLREDTEPAPAELREQDRISPEEEQLSGLEPVPMAEPERDCAAPALSSLQPECVTAHREGRDAHHTHTSLIKTETELDSTLTGDLIKTESLDSSELGNVVHLQPDQIKTETDDGSYMKAEHMPTSPLNMLTSPLSMPTSPLSMLTSPLSMPTSPLNMLTSPLNMPTEHAHIPTEYAHIPTEHAHIPTEYAHIPTEHAHIPTEYAHIPTEHAHIPTEYAHIPTEYAHIPTEHAHIPTEYAHIPTEHAHIPTEYAHIPTEHAHIPTEYAHIPTEHAYIPTEYAHIPTEHAYIPTEYAHIPTEYAHIPTEHAHIPTEYAHIPTEHAHIPTEYAHIPTEHTHIPSEYAHIPTEHAHIPTEYAHIPTEHAHPPDRPQEPPNARTECRRRT
ncbi:hypothetical protein JZ751_013988 [Albula glossodonta]|uniref:THAP domain-containing protein 1 n=1 Tax=Albula glossodonta TaxID=121402 RepID=A0A8T2MX83_9TELE|nr:hypothetical protein JZ751_013988 [Albula glossodonta]